nr:PREDICTED: uncharacterized protein LOC105667894 isoform X1 [Linepithema humile]
MSVVLRDYIPNSESKTTGGCYFPAEYQGEFVMQVSGMGAGGIMYEPIQYSTINITFNSIPVWGYCHERKGDNVLLMDRYGEKDCVRCIRLQQRSRNVIEVFSQALNQCYTRTKLASESCAKLDTASILYRAKEIGGLAIRNEYCPIRGQYHFKYTINNDSSFECNSFASEINNCLDGSVLHWNFKRCNFRAHNLTYNCLGSWPGPNGSNYLALWDPDAVDGRPQYRCGLYHVDNAQGKTYMAFSSDSSCTQDLNNSSSGYETLILSKRLNEKKVPDYVQKHVATFPKWAQGVWEESFIDNGTMTFTDVNGYNSYTFITVHSNEVLGRYSAYSTEQCEQSTFMCLIMHQRSENVMEFTIAHTDAPIFGPLNLDFPICNDLIMNDLVWMTQARIERVESPCPITGQYHGEIPDLLGMCAEISSNCNTREMMYFRVIDCESGELFEERTYLCLGQWEEKGKVKGEDKNVTYTYTMRNDTNTKYKHECFVGFMVDDDEIYIKEAGDHCVRNIDPIKQGMRLSKKGHCYGNLPSPAPTFKPIKTNPHDPTLRITTTPWSKISGATQMPGNTVSSSIPCRSSTYTNLTLLVTVLIAFLNAAFSYTLG